MAGIKSFAAIALGISFVFIQSVSAADKLPIWELQGTDNRVLLMGSIHFLRASDYPLPDGFLSAYEQADALVMEVDMDDLDPVTAQATITRLGISQDGRTLKDFLDPSEYSQAIQYAATLGVPEMLLQGFEPWFAALTLSQMQMLALGFDPNWGIETQMTQRAAQDGKTIDGLETLEEQLGFLDRLDADTQQMFLQQTIEEGDQIPTMLDALLAAWRSGDADVMAELFLEDMRAAPELYDAVLVQRNRRWVSSISDLTTRDEDYLVIVGALHLVGEDSVINMLKDNGISSRQLASQDLH